MQQFRMWPLALAVSSVVLLAGCLGGSGGSSSPSSGSPSAGAGGDTGGNAGGADGGGAGEDPGSDTRTFTAYSITVDTPDLVGRQAPASDNLSRLVATIGQLIAPYAQAQSTASPNPDDIRVALMGGDDNGTPNDPSDDRDLYLTPGDDYRVEQGDSGLLVLLPFEPRFDHYIEVATGGALSLSVPTYQTSLVADPVSTFVTRMLASRASEFDLLTTQEVDELLADIRQIAQDPAISAAIVQAYASASSTQALLDAISDELYAVVDARLEESLTPPISSDVLGTVNGRYHFQRFGLGAYDNGQSVGLVVRGANREAELTSIGDGQVRKSVAGVSDSLYEAVHDIFGYVGIRVSIETGTVESTQALDSRGIIVPENISDRPFERSDSTAPRCQPLSAECRDQRFVASQRLMTAGPANMPFNTLAGNVYDDRLVDEAQGTLELRVTNAATEIGVRKPAGVLPLDGEYGVLETSHFDIGNSLRMDWNLYDASFAGNQATFCRRASHRLVKLMPSYAIDYSADRNDDCTTPDDQLNYTASAIFAEQGALAFTQVFASNAQNTTNGFASADGLTFLANRQSPAIADLIANNQTRVEVPVGDRWWGFA